MAAHDYQFVTRWSVKSTVEETSEIIKDVADLSRWWPAVYIDVRKLLDGDEQGVGGIFSLNTKGWLPYTLKWQFRLTESREPFGYTLIAWGDLIGRGVWDFRQRGDLVDITYDWRVSASKPVIRRLSFLLKPVFSSNHYWAMRTGEESLRLELARRHADTESERAQVPEPPQPTFAKLIRQETAWQINREAEFQNPNLAG